MKLLHDDTELCFWTSSTALFKSGHEKMDNDGVICVAQGKFSKYQKDFRLVISDE
jgi:hypothetical protein